MANRTCSTVGCDNLIPPQSGRGAPRQYCLVCRPRRVDLRRRTRPSRTFRVRPCELCGVIIESGTVRKRYCSRECQVTAYHRRSRGLIEDACLVCGDPIGSERYFPFRGGVKHNRCFEHGTEYGYQKHGCRCDACVAAKRAEWREWVTANPDKVEAYNARRREKAARERWPDGVPDCLGCGEPMREPQPGKRPPTHKACEHLVPNWKLKGRAEPGWFSAVRKRLERAERGVSRNRPFVQGKCPGCGEVFLAAGRAFCSPECRELLRRAEVERGRVERRKSAPACRVCGEPVLYAQLGEGKATHARCGKSSSSQFADSVRRFVYERDRFTCHLCRRKVDVGLAHPDPLSASIDHVVPRSHGGSDDVENLRLSHLRCNYVRRDLAVSEARRVIRQGAELSLLW